MVHFFNLITSHSPSFKVFHQLASYSRLPHNSALTISRNHLIVNNLTSPSQSTLQASYRHFTDAPVPLFFTADSSQSRARTLPTSSTKTGPRHLVSLSPGFNGTKSLIQSPLKINHLHQHFPPQKVFVKSLPFLGCPAFKAYLCASLNG